MNDNIRTGGVTGIYVVSDTASTHYGQQLVNVDTGGPDGTAGVVNSLPGYVPQVGDNIAIQDLGGGLWIVIGDFTPNRGVAIPTVPRVHIQNGGTPAGYTQISTWYFQTGVLDQPNLIAVPTATVTPPTGGVVGVAATATRSYRYDFGGSWSTDNDRVYQGIYGGFGPWAGLWFYNGTIAGLLSGKTPTRIQMALRRAGSGGSAGAVQLHFYLHSHNTIPAGAPTLASGPNDVPGAALSWSADATVDLPLDWANQLKAGTATGIGIYATDQASYSILAGLTDYPASGQLAITYT